MCILLQSAVVSAAPVVTNPWKKVMSTDAKKDQLREEERQKTLVSDIKSRL